MEITGLRGDEACYILIDRYYEGQMNYQGDRWHAHLNSKTILTSDDLQIIFDMLDKAQKKQ